MIVLTCSKCNKKFSVYLSVMKNKKNIFCSKKCYWSIDYGKVKLNCSKCGKKIFKFKSVYKKNKGNHAFCNISCYNSWKYIRRINTFCNTCKKPIIRKINGVGKRGVFYCSNSCSSKDQPLGKKSKKWKGGISKNFQGYILQYVPSEKSSKKRHILQHRLVMEKHLKRYLKPFEIIHHKNGIKHDNRIGNLELCVKRQPPGQRLFDLLKFVTKNYPEELKQMLYHNS